MGVPGVTGAGELAGALMPAPAPSAADSCAAVRISVVKLNWKENVGERVVVIIDVYGVLHAVVEGGEDGTVTGLKEGVDIHDEGNLGRVVVTDKGEEARDIGGMVEGGGGCVAMIGGKSGGCKKQYYSQNYAGENADAIHNTSP
jgi:hypothetical protein